MKNMRKRIKIASTASGLGGFSITAFLAERLRRERQFEKVELTFFNYRPSEVIGCDNLPDSETKADFAKKATVPVIGIVSNGVKQIYGFDSGL